jgi:hypothetical protein
VGSGSCRACYREQAPQAHLGCRQSPSPARAARCHPRHAIPPAPCQRPSGGSQAHGQAPAPAAAPAAEPAGGRRDRDGVGELQSYWQQVGHGQSHARFAPHVPTEGACSSLAMPLTGCVGAHSSPARRSPRSVPAASRQLGSRVVAGALARAGGSFPPPSSGMAPSFTSLLRMGPVKPAKSSAQGHINRSRAPLERTAQQAARAAGPVMAGSATESATQARCRQRAVRWPRHCTHLASGSPCAWR